MRKNFIAPLLLVLFISANATQRNVLVEMFTNSHCSICPGAHAAIQSYKTTSSNANRVRYIYYHTTFPYSDDPLSQANTTEPNARNTYYNGPTSTPNTYFDGINQGRTYSAFGTNIDARMSTESPIEIILNGSKNGNVVSISALLKKTGSITETDLVVHMVAVENVSYIGRNGVSPQDYVMRKMITGTSGQSMQFDQSNNAVVTASSTLTNTADMSKVGIVVFVQSVSTKIIYQSEYISHAILTTVSLDDGVPGDFRLFQNYPNPFNPETTIKYSVPKLSYVSITVFDVLGNKMATLVNKQLPANDYELRFQGTELPSGIYFYTLTINGVSKTRKMLLIK